MIVTVTVRGTVVTVSVAGTAALNLIYQQHTARRRRWLPPGADRWAGPESGYADRLGPLKRQPTKRYDVRLGCHELEDTRP